MKKTLITIAVTVLACFCVVGATLAFLVDKTDTIVNTFTVGNVDIELTETGTENNQKSFKLIPGAVYTKDPTVTVIAGSEICYVFVKIEVANNASQYLDYGIAGGWEQLKDDSSNVVSGIYFRIVDATEATDNIQCPVLVDNKVTVKNTLTSNELGKINPDLLPTLRFTAYAVQQEGFTSAYAAWCEAEKLDTP